MVVVSQVPLKDFRLLQLREGLVRASWEAHLGFCVGGKESFTVELLWSLVQSLLNESLGGQGVFREAELTADYSSEA